MNRNANMKANWQRAQQCEGVNSQRVVGRLIAHHIYGIVYILRLILYVCKPPWQLFRFTSPSLEVEMNSMPLFRLFSALFDDWTSFIQIFRNFSYGPTRTTDCETLKSESPSVDLSEFKLNMRGTRHATDSVSFDIFKNLINLAIDYMCSYTAVCWCNLTPPTLTVSHSRLYHHTALRPHHTTNKQYMFPVHWFQAKNAASVVRKIHFSYSCRFF